MKKNNNMKKNIWLDGMMGLIVGDALGVPVQFMSRDEIKYREKGLVKGMESGGVYNMPEGTWSDDSSMALATMASMMESTAEKKAVDPADIMQRFVDWDFDGEYTPFGEAFDQGLTCTSAIDRFYRNHDYKTCGSTGEHSNGNGALMRILPACLYYYDRQRNDGISDEEAIEGVHAISALTHNHLRSNMCCGLYYFMVRSIIENHIAQRGVEELEPHGRIKELEKQKGTGQCGSGTSKKNSRPLIDLMQDGVDKGLKHYGKDESNLKEMAHLGRLFYLAELRDTPENEIKSSGYVIDSIEAAVWCLITTDSYKECMLKAVNLGDDTDTVAAIAGGLAGLYYGYEEIPEDWLSVIKRREWLEAMCRDM